jgi:hypothetical protein
MAHDEAKGGIACGAFTFHTLRLPHKESGRASGPCAGDPCRRWALDAPACRIHPSSTTATKWEVINSRFGLFDRALHALFFLANPDRDHVHVLRLSAPVDLPGPFPGRRCPRDPSRLFTRQHRLPTAAPTTRPQTRPATSTTLPAH